MSLKETFTTQIPNDTQALGQAVVKADSLYRFVGNTSMQAWYSREGRSGITPLLLLRVTLFQFVEKLPDCHAFSIK